MAVSKRKTKVSRKNGQPTPSSSRVGTRSQTPASKASQRNTPAPANTKERPNGHLHAEIDTGIRHQTPSTPPQRATNGTKRTLSPVPSTLTEAHLAELSNGYQNDDSKAYKEATSSPLSSPPASMKEALEAYFNRSKHAPFLTKEATSTTSAKDEVVDITDGPTSGLADLHGLPEAPEDVATPSASTPRDKYQASPFIVTTATAEEVEAAVNVPNAVKDSTILAGTVFANFHVETRQASPTTLESNLAEMETLVDESNIIQVSPDLTTTISAKAKTPVVAVNGVQDPPATSSATAAKKQKSAYASNGVSGSLDLTTIDSAEGKTWVDPAIGPHGSQALATLANLEPSIAAPKCDESQSRSSRKRSLSFADELAIPDPPVTTEPSKAITRSRRNTKSNSPSSNPQSDLALNVDEVGSSVSNENKSVEGPLRRSKRAKIERKADIEFDPDDMELPYEEATEAEIEEWDGWLEMESSPETLTVMLQEWGVRGMKAIDVYSLEPDDLVVLPQPVHGLIFCYPYRDGDWGEQMDPCPNHVWFANQVDGTNACGTVALMNILNNVPDANLGPSLHAFKTDTQPMNAVERGQCLDSFQPIKAVHNSFIRIKEMMEDDLLAEKDHEAREKKASIEAQKKAKAKLAAKKKRAAEKAARKRERAAAKAAAHAVREGKSAEGGKGSLTDKTGAGVAKSEVTTKKKAPAKKASSANAKNKITTPEKPKETPATAKASAKKKADALARARHHYVAYLPINGEIWKLDGMDNQPLNLGPCDHVTWLDSVAPLIQASMIDLSQESIDFSLLAVVQDPLYNDTMDLAANIKTMQQVDEELAKVDPEWPMHEDAVDCLGDESLEGPSDDYKVTVDMIDMASPLSANQEQIQESKGVGSLLKLKKNLISQQKMLKSSIRSGKTEEDERQALVDRRRRDFGPLIQWQLMDLIDEGVLDELLDLHDSKKKDSGAKKGNGKTKSKAKGRKR